MVGLLTTSLPFAASKHYAALVQTVPAKLAYPRLLLRRAHPLLKMALTREADWKLLKQGRGVAKGTNMEPPLPPKAVAPNQPYIRLSLACIYQA